MSLYPKVVEEAIDLFRRFPGIGTKTAKRLVLFLLNQDKAFVETFASKLIEMKKTVHPCPICFNITDEKICHICASDTRDKTKICVVEETGDLIAIESTGKYNGVYHVLGGVISPMRGVEPENLHIDELLNRITAAEPSIGEIIIATNPDVEGDTTALYLENKLKPLGILITRIARGLPQGGDLKYADSKTLAKAIENRKPE